MEEKNRPRQPQEEEQPSALSDMLGALGFKSKSQRAGKQENIRRMFLQMEKLNWSGKSENQSGAGRNNPMN